MRVMMLVFLLLVGTTDAAGQVRVALADVDSLVLPYTLGELTEPFREKLVHDRILLRQRVLRVTQAFYQFRAAKREITLMQSERDNLAAIYRLNRQRQAHAAIDDEDVLRSHNQLLAKEIGLLQRIETCRTSLLAIFEICNVEVMVGDERSTLAQRIDRR